jgi:hypothetical protein
MNRTVLLYILGPVLVAVVVFGILRFFHITHTRTVATDVVQGVLLGAALSFTTVLLVLPNFYVTKINGWTTMFGCGEPGRGLLRRAACNVTFMGPINAPQEAMYWTTRNDGAGYALSGAHEYVLHFAAGQLPPNTAFWSLTMGDAGNRFVPNPIGRYNIGDRTGLVPNADGSVDIYIRHGAPAGHEANWLPAPVGNFILWLRIYLPGQAVLDGTYKVPPIVRVS